MTINEATSRLRGMVKEHFSDSVLRDRFLWNIIWSATKLLIHRELQRKDLSNLSIYQTYNIDVEEVDILEDSCVPDHCFKCRAKVPKLMETESGPVYKFIGTPDYSREFVFTSINSARVKTKIRGNKEAYAYQVGTWLYLTRCYPCIVIVGIPEGDVKTGCNKRGAPAPIPGHLEESVFRMAFENLSIFLQKQYDHVPNKNTTT